MNLTWFKVLGLTLALSLSGAIIGCEVDDENADGTAGEGGDATTGDTGEGGADTGEGGGNTDPCDNADEDCGQNGFCCFLCQNDATHQVTDPDCNPNTPFNSDKANKDGSPNGCDCDYWGLVCEASVKCSTTACDCDPDCTLPDNTLFPACGLDGHCDTWCTTSSDLDCQGTADDGKYCN